jgi:hypothetical protein
MLLKVAFILEPNVNFISFYQLAQFFYMPSQGQDRFVQSWALVYGTGIQTDEISVGIDVRLIESGTVLPDDSLVISRPIGSGDIPNDVENYEVVFPVFCEFYQLATKTGLHGAGPINQRSHVD